MKIIFLLIIYFLCFNIGFSSAQAYRLKYIGIETGMTFIGGEMSNMDFVRGDIPFYNPVYSTNSLISFAYKNFIGIKYEIFSLNDRFGLLGGLRFSRLNSNVGKNSYWINSTNYFYCLFRQDGVNTEYLKVKEINQKSDYIGIPIELRYFPAKRPRLVRVFLKMGAEINFLMRTQSDIVFNDNTMNLYKEELIAKLGQPKTFYSLIYGGGGIRIGRDLKPSVSFEACLPYLFLTSKSAGLVNPIYGGGFQINVQIPLK